MPGHTCYLPRISAPNSSKAATTSLRLNGTLSPMSLLLLAALLIAFAEFARFSRTNHGR